MIYSFFLGFLTASSIGICAYNARDTQKQACLKQLAKIEHVLASTGVVNEYYLSNLSVVTKLVQDISDDV